MKITAIKTPLVKEGDNLFAVITNAIDRLPEASVLAVSSKIISFSQSRLLLIQTGSSKEKHDLIAREADLFLPCSISRYDLMFTIKHGHLTVNAGIDESNAAGKYVLWPENLQETLNQLWVKLREHYQINQLGLIVTDSRTWPLRWGVVGTCLAHCGFKQLHDYRGEKDLFEREIHFVQVNVAEAMASFSVLEMGEVAEQTPLGIIESASQIEFQDRPPTAQELADLKIDIEDDMYGPLLTSVKWHKGGGGIKL
ncbi:MAG TPA: coenzyme F420-0:L-glutamate ligase [Candidatus Woesebacteria bacterium]|nr:coenzyme F420-0:L-glutamate ligase [Candidatus Woesebacteria bacterium]